MPDQSHDRSIERTTTSRQAVRRGRIGRAVLLALLALFVMIGVVAAVRTWRRGPLSNHGEPPANVGSAAARARDGANGAAQSNDATPPIAGTLTVPAGVPMAGSPFLGRSDCAECHAEVVDAFLHSGHSNTFARSAESPLARMLDGRTFTDPERRVKYAYQWNPRGLFVTQPDDPSGSQFPLQFVVGSGKHGGATFVTLLPNPTTGGVIGLEHRVSWHGPDRKLIVTPGHEGLTPNHPLESLGRVLDQSHAERCFGCHVTEFVLQGADAERLFANVECENCHGSARDHVRRMQTSGDKAESSPEDGGTLIAHGRKSESARHQIERCGACHRLPGDVEQHLIFPGSKSIVRFQPIGILQSRCFVESGESFRCTTCHNPHAPPEVGDRAIHEAVCVKCHADGARRPECTTSKPTDMSTTGCIACHMPSVEVQNGMRFHDHWIRRSTTAPTKPESTTQK